MSAEYIQSNKKVSFRKIAVNVSEVLIFIITFAFVILPILWGIITSFKSESEVVAFPPKFFNFKPVWDNYISVFAGGYLDAFKNSILYSIFTIIFGILLGMLAAYGLDRYQFRFRKLLFYIVIAGIPLAIGSSVLLIPNYVYFSLIGLVNKPYTLIVLYTAYNLPMAIWIMRGGLEHIPIEIEDAALIDGCSRSYIIFNLIPHLNRPAMASASIFLFIGAWNEFLVASVMVQSNTLRPIQLAIYYFMGYFGVRWGPLCAASICAIVPILIAFSILGKQLVSGLMQGSVKG